MKITLTSIIVKDPEAAFKFYTEVLGFHERMYIPDAKLAIVVSPEQPDGTGLLLEPNDNPVSKTFQEALYQQGIPAIVFGVEDVQSEYEKLMKLGVHFKKGPTKEVWGTVAILDDTCGNYIQIHQA